MIIDGGATHASWTSEGTAVLDRARQHYGGLETWRALRQVRLFPERLSGFVPWLKGVHDTFALPKAIEVRPHEGRTTFLDYPDDAHVGIFENGSVRIQSRDGEGQLLVSDDHRRTFRGFAKNRRWAPIDALYFFGYALAHYHALPFTLSAARLIRVTTGGTRRAPLDVLHVEFPENVATHGARQAFYFEKHGQLVRHDYHAEVVGTWARGAHFWKREVRVEGFPIAMERHVVLRLGAFACPLTALHATFSNAEVELGS